MRATVGLSVLWVMLGVASSGCSSVATNQARDRHNVENFSTQRIVIPLPIIARTASTQLTANSSDEICPPGSRPQTSRAFSSRAVKGVGYGAPPSSGMPAPQRRILALRAAKLDAYRDLSEKIAGLHITSNSNISNLAIQNDRFSAYVDATVRDARLVSQTMSSDGIYEVTLEVTMIGFGGSAESSSVSCVPDSPAAKPKAGKAQKQPAANLSI